MRTRNKNNGAGQGDELRDVLVAIVNFKTDRITRRALESVRAVYPDVRICVYDNGSHDQSTRHLKEAAQRDHRLGILLGRANIGHGPALHNVMINVSPQFVFTLDSDATITKPGVLEAMRDVLQSFDSALGVGHVTMVDREGRNGPRAKGERTIRYVHPFAAMWDRRVYNALGAEFIHHGAPALRVCVAAQRAGLRLIEFPAADYVRHKGKGTRSKHGNPSYNWDVLEDLKGGNGEKG